MPAAVEKRPAGDVVHVPGMPARKRESEALPAKAWRSARRNKAVSVPAAVPVVTWSAAEIMHASGTGWEAAAAGAAASAAVWWLAPHKWTDRDGKPRWPEVWYARATVAVFSAWTSATAVAGPVSLPAAVSLALLSAAWGYPYWRHNRVRGSKDRRRLLEDWRQFWYGHSFAWGVGGSNVIEAEEKRSQIRLRVQLIPGRQSAHSVTGSVHLIESALQGYAGIGRVRVEPVRENASQVDVFMKRENPLRETVEWDPSLAPASVHDTALQGLDETGEWRRVPQLISSFVLGATRTGKSNDLLLHVAQLAGCPDARTVVIDLKRRSAHALLPVQAADYVITTVDEARAYLAMVEAEIAARSAGAYDGEEQLRATPATPAVMTFCDEVNPLASAAGGDAACARLLAVIASQGAGLAVFLRVYTQYGALHESVRSEQVRMNLDMRVCYRVKEPDHGQFAIANYHLFDASKLEEKGTHLLQVGKDSYPEHIRAPLMSHDLFRAAVPEALERRGPRRQLMLWCGAEPSVVPGLTWQEWWDRRWLRLDPRFREISPQYASAAEEFGEPEEASPAPAAPPAPAGVPGDDEDGAAAAARIAAETEGPDAEPVPGAAPRASEITARNQGRFFALLASAPPGGARTADLTADSGVSSGWAYNTLNRLLDRGAVTQPGRGRWAPVPGRDGAAEAAALKAGDDALIRGAEGRYPHLRPVG